MRTCFLCLILAFAASGCLTFSSFQSAAITPSGTTASSVGISRNNWDDIGDSESAWVNVEFQGRTGTRNERIDRGLKTTVSLFGGRLFGVSVGADARVGIIPERLTLQLPATLLLGDLEFDTLQLHPTLIGSIPLSPKLEVNASWSVFIYARAGEAAQSASIGLAIKGAGPNLTIRPEIAWLSGIDGLDSSRQFGLAFEFHASADSVQSEDPDKPWW